LLFDFLLRAKSAILIVAATALLASILGLSGLQISTDNRIFYGPENRYYKDYLNFETEFSSNDNIIFVLTAPYTIQEGEFPAAIRWLTQRAVALDGVIRIDSLANYPHPSSDDGLILVESILDWACPEDGPCIRDLDAELAGTHLVNRLVSSDKRSTGVIATLSIERGAVGRIEALHTATEELASEFVENFPEFEINFTGGVPMMAAFARATAEDLSVLLPSALVVVSLLLYLVLGSLRLTLVIVALGLSSIVVTLGIAGWSGHTINNATSIVPLIVFTLVVASSMHIAVHFSRSMKSRFGLDEATSQARASLTSTAVPILLSSATSAVSLCSLSLVDSPPIRQLGMFSATGVVVGAVLTVLVLPLLLVYVRSVGTTRLSRVIQALINAYAKMLEQGRHFGLVASLAFVIAATGLTNLVINDDFVKFFEESVPFRQQTDRATELLAGPNHIEVVAIDKVRGVFEPGFIRYVAQLTEHLRSNSLVANVHSFSDVMDKISQAYSDKPVSAIASADELAQLFLIYELSLQIGQSNTDLINVSQDSARISVLLKESTSAEIQDLESSIYKWSNEQHSEYGVVVTGENIPVAHLSHMNIKAMLSGIFVSLAFTSLCLGVVFRSLRLGIVALGATTIPVIAGFGIWGWITAEIGLAATGIIALTIGVVVDDAAHYIYRFLDGRNRLFLGPWAAAGYATHRTGAAIASTSVVLGAGLALLLLSSFKVNSSFGAVACLIIGTALAFNLTILPQLVVWASRTTAEEGGAALEYS
jgi:uncharacterized protein